MRGAERGEDGYIGLAPAAQFAPNAYGLYDVAGNVWEWTSDWYRPDYYASVAASGVARNPRGPADSFDPSEPGQPKRVHRGGSYLCTEQYCTRYMLGTRGKGEVRTGSNHVGFRCVRSPAARSFTVQPSARRAVFAVALAVPVIRISREVAASSRLARAASSVVTFWVSSVQRSQSTGSSATAVLPFLATTPRESPRMAETGSVLFVSASISALSSAW